jgi:hypothetical protein
MGGEYDGARPIGITCQLATDTPLMRSTDLPDGVPSLLARRGGGGGRGFAPTMPRHMSRCTKSIQSTDIPLTKSLRPRPIDPKYSAVTGTVSEACVRQCSPLVFRMVTDCLRHHQGGRRFFEAIDDHCRSRAVIDLLLRFAAIDPRRHRLAASGKFGDALTRFHPELAPMVVRFGGGISGDHYRCEVPRDVPVRASYVFLDDSLYSGGTRRAISRRLAETGSHLAQTFVVYDGSLAYDPSVRSLFRYHGWTRTDSDG